MKAPEYFNEATVNYFNFIVEELNTIDKFDSTNRPVIEALAFNLSTLEECQKILMKEGFVIDGLHGKKEHPALGISMKAQAKVLESFKVLGLDASMRLKTENKEGNQSSDFLTSLLGGKI